MDTAGNCMFINRAGARLLGYKPKELIGRQMHDMVHYRRRDGSKYPQSECPIFLASQRGKSAAAEDEVFWKRDGTPLAVEYSTSPIIQDGEWSHLRTSRSASQRSAR
jgi:PAS domain S-box-containing protein